MLRKILWTGLYSGLAGAAAFGARRIALTVWRAATGHDPPTKTS